jgi:large subunit ribosomal protein L15
MELKDLRPLNSNKKKRRVGRGPGSGRGKTSGRGHKGAKSRSGTSFYGGFEGGNVPFFRKIPKRGFNHKKRVSYQCVNVTDLVERFEKNQQVTPDRLAEKNLIKSGAKPVKILGKGSIDLPLIVSAHKFSEKAKSKIEKAGGRVECLKQ